MIDRRSVAVFFDAGQAADIVARMNYEYGDSDPFWLEFKGTGA